MKASNLIALLDGRATNDTETIADVQRVIDEKGMEAAKLYWLHGQSTGENMTPSQTAKHYGCKSLRQVSDLTGQSEQTLINWHRDKPELYRIVCIGCGVATKPPHQQ